MKQKLFFFAFLLISFQGYTTPVLPTENCLLIDHLIEVNKEWAAKNLTEAFLFEPYHFDNDKDRIQKHLQLVTHFLSQENTSHLTDIQTINRQKQLTELTFYWKAKQFPINTKHSQRQPYFVDDFGTACAVGHLVLESGETTLVGRITNEMNYAYLKEMPYPELTTWANKNGFSAAELAWIQPTYPPPSYAFHQLGNNNGIEGKVNIMKANPTDDLLYIAGDFTTIDGLTANDIIAYDGENWQIIDNEIDGEIFDMTFDAEGNLLVVGAFQIGNSENAALYTPSEQTWSGIGIQAMDGIIKTVEIWEEKMVIGGDFSAINGVDLQNLAYTESDLFNWRNSVEIMENGEMIIVENAFGVDGVVNDLVINEQQLFIGGEFSMTAPNATELLDSIGQVAVVNIAEWSDNSWKNEYESTFPVTAMYQQDSIFVTGGVTAGFSEDGGNCLNFFEPSDSTFYINDNNLLTNGIISYNGEIFLYGDFFLEPAGPFIWMSYSLNLVSFERGSEYWYSNRGFEINAPVTAAVEFKNKLYLAGEFTEASSFPVNNLAWTELELGIFDSTDEINTQPDNIYTADNQLYIKDLPVSKTSQLSLYNLQGQLVETFTLEAGQADFQYSLEHLSSGAMVYYLETEAGQYSGKVLKF